MQQVFTTTLNQILVFFLIMIVGFFINRKKIVPDNADKVLSKLLADIIGPVLSFETFAAKFTVENLQQKASILLWSIAVLAVAILAANLLARLFSKDSYERYLYEYSLIIPNLGYMGYPLTLAVFGQDALFDMMMFCIPLNIYIFSYAIVKMNPASTKFSWKNFATPQFIMMGIGMIFGLFRIQIPNFVSTTLSTISGCMGPVAMLLAGFVIAQYNLKSTVLNGKVYIIALLRLIVLPGIYILALKGLNTPEYLINAATCALCLPMGLNTVVFPAAFGGDTRPGASMALISSGLSVITIPVMFAIFVG